MKRIAPLIALMSVLYSGVSSASPLVVYGEDNRQEVIQAPTRWQVKAKSVAVRVAKDQLISNLLGQSLLGRTLKETNTSFNRATGEEITFCEGTPFINQPNPASCTGFLVAPDLLLTAGHCVSSETMCEDFNWVFDFQVDQNQAVDLGVSLEKMYSCKKIIRSMTPEMYGMDFALIQLDRNTDRASLELNIAANIGKNDKVLMIGSPLGLPLKIAGDAKVRDDDQPNYFSATLDSFFGNSGSPVFNQRTGKVEGILVNGEEDHVFDLAKMCLKINRCEEDECRGEDASRIVTVPELALRDSLQTAAREGNIKFFDELDSVKSDLYIDIYGADKVSPLMTALKFNNLKIAEKLLKLGADPKHVSLDNQTPTDIVNQSEDENFKSRALELLKIYSK